MMRHVQRGARCFAAEATRGERDCGSGGLPLAWKGGPGMPMRRMERPTGGGGESLVRGRVVRARIVAE